MNKIDMNKRYKTRSGLDVEIISVKGREPYPVVGYMGDVFSIMVWTEYGFWTGCPEHANDLVEVKKTETKYQYFYRDIITGQCFLSANLFSKENPPTYGERFEVIGPLEASAQEYEVE